MRRGDSRPTRCVSSNNHASRRLLPNVPCTRRLSSVENANLVKLRRLVGKLLEQVIDLQQDVSPCRKEKAESSFSMRRTRPYTRLNIDTHTPSAWQLQKRNALPLPG